MLLIDSPTLVEIFHTAGHDIERVGEGVYSVYVPARSEIDETEAGKDARYRFTLTVSRAKGLADPHEQPKTADDLDIAAPLPI